MNSKGMIAAVVIFFVLLFAYSKWGPAIPFSVLSQARGEPMVVTGEGKAIAVPDIAKVSAGIQGSGQNLAQIQDSVNKKSQSLVSALKKLGIEDKDIRTTSYNIFPQSDFNANPPVINGYQVSINYEITVRKVDSINNVLTTVTGAGANLVGGVNFDLSDEAEAKALDTARQDAVVKAKQSAESLAKASGVTLGKIINISENQNNSVPRPIALTAQGSGAPEKAVAQPNVQPGTTEIDIMVSLSYEIR